MFRSVYRRKTDLMPTIPSPRDGHYGSRSSLSTTPRTPGKDDRPTHYTATQSPNPFISLTLSISAHRHSNSFYSFIHCRKKLSPFSLFHQHPQHVHQLFSSSSSFLGQYVIIRFFFLASSSPESCVGPHPPPSQKPHD